MYVNWDFFPPLCMLSVLTSVPGLLADLSPNEMALWEVIFKVTPAALFLFFVKMDTNDSEAAQMETKAYQEDQVIKSKDAHSAEGRIQLKHLGLEDTQNTGNIHNGEYRCRLSRLCADIMS